MGKNDLKCNDLKWDFPLGGLNGAAGIRHVTIAGGVTAQLFGPYKISTHPYYHLILNKQVKYSQQ